MTRLMNLKPDFSTLIVVPDRWRHERAVNSPLIMFCSWDELRNPTILRGRRFDQVIAMGPPTNAEQSRIWFDLSTRLNPGGQHFYM